MLLGIGIMHWFDDEFGSNDETLLFEGELRPVKI